MSESLSSTDLYLIGRLLKDCDQNIATYHKYSDLTTASLTSNNVRDSLAKFHKYGLVPVSALQNPDRPRGSSRLISLTPKGLAFAVQNADRILVATADNGSVVHYNEVRNALRRIGALDAADGTLTVESDDWTGRSSRYLLSAAQKAEVSNRLRGIERSLDLIDLSQTEREQVRASLAASIILSEAPEPAYDIILRLLILLSSIATIGTAIGAVIGLITGSK